MWKLLVILVVIKLYAQVMYLSKIIFYFFTVNNRCDQGQLGAISVDLSSNKLKLSQFLIIAIVSSLIQSLTTFTNVETC